LNKLAYKWNW